MVLSSRTKTRREKVTITPIVDKTEEKRKQLELYRKEQEQNKQILNSLIKEGKITLDKELKLSKIERRYIQKLLASKSKKETEFGLNYEINKLDGTCKIISEDGTFIMNSLEIEFERSI